MTTAKLPKGHTRYVRTIARLERMNLSRNGNPRFRIYFTDGSVATTQPDAAVAYGLENPEFRTGPVELTATAAGLVYYVEPAS